MLAYPQHAIARELQRIMPGRAGAMRCSAWPGQHRCPLVVDGARPGHSRPTVTHLDMLHCIRTSRLSWGSPHPNCGAVRDTASQSRSCKTMLNVLPLPGAQCGLGRGNDGGGVRHAFETARRAATARAFRHMAGLRTRPGIIQPNAHKGHPRYSI